MTLVARLHPPPVAASIIAIFLAVCLGLAPANAGVVVLTNRSAAAVEFTIVGTDGQTSRHSLTPRDVVPIPAQGKIEIRYSGQGGSHRYLLRPNSIYFFYTRDEKLEFSRLALAEEPSDEPPAAPPTQHRELAPLYTIPVMLLVDDDERAVRRIWEARLRQRLQKASDIFERSCRVRFEAVAIGTWTSDDEVNTFEDTLRDFERAVNPAPARLAIGFTSQYRIPKGRTHMGGIRGPLHSHILIREWAQHVSEPERLEILVHELGHYLGATHSAESDSVMRPTLGDRQSRARSFRIGFDAVNTLIIYLVGEELRSGRRIRGFSGLDGETRACLRAAYTAMSHALPKDPAAKSYLQLLDRSPIVSDARPRHPDPLVKATQAVIRELSAAAQENHDLPPPSAAATAGHTRLEGDRLMEYYVRRAAGAAAKLPEEVAAKAFLLGLGIALDDSAALRDLPLASSLCRQVDPAGQWRRRLAVLGSPTMRGRRDLAKHFTVSCVVTILFGPGVAEAAGVRKELLDSRRRSGFSFLDLTADLAGSTFATEVRDAQVPLTQLAASFTVEDFLPEGSDLEEGISWSDFLQQYSSAEGQRFRRRQAAIRERILALPGYQKPQRLSGKDG